MKTVVWILSLALAGCVALTLVLIQREKSLRAPAPAVARNVNGYVFVGPKRSHCGESAINGYYLNCDPEHDPYDKKILAEAGGRDRKYGVYLDDQEHQCLARHYIWDSPNCWVNHHDEESANGSEAGSLRFTSRVGTTAATQVRPR